MLCGIPIFAVKVENLGERGALLNAFKLLQKELKDSDLINEYAPSITERMRSGSMASFGRGRAGSTASLMRSRASSLFSLANQRARGMSNADTFGVNANINAPASKAPKSDGFVYSVQHVEPPIYEDSKEDSNSEDSEDNKMEFDFNTPLQLLSVSLLTSCTILFSLVLMKKTSII